LIVPLSVERGRKWSLASWRVATLLAGTCLGTVAAHAVDGTWLPTPATNDWNTGTNWSSSPLVPDGTASFDASNTATLTFSQPTTDIGTIQFNPGAPNYTFTLFPLQTLNITAAGIVNNASGAPTFSAFVSSLVFQNSSTAGNATINNVAGGIFFNDSSNAGNATINNGGGIFFNDNSAGGTAIINNMGVVIFANFSTAANATITSCSCGSLLFADSSTAGNATIINNGSSTQFMDNSTAGNAAIITNNNGTTQFSGNSTAGAATITTNNGGATGFFNASTAGNATIITNNGGFTAFFDNSTGGGARFITNAGGAVDFSGSLGPAGDGKITAGSIEGAGNYFIGGGNTLIVGGSNLSTEVSGVIADSCGCNPGPGSLVKVGSGTLILSGANAYTGTTDVNAGTLIVNGSIATSSLTTVNSGGALGGSGTVGKTQINAGGIFAPGAGTAGSSMTVAGNLAFQSGAIYLVQANPSTASFANVAGTASLAGNVQAVFAAGTYAPRSYTILHSAGLNGTAFGGIAGNAPANFVASLSYTATDVLLNLTPQLGANAGASFNLNQQAVANAINGFVNNGGSLPPGFLGLLNLTGGNLANALTLLSGEAATGAQQGAFQLISEFLSLMLDPFVDGRAGAAFGPASAFAPEREPLPDDIALAYARVLKAPAYKAPATFEQRWTAWASAYGGGNKTSGDPLVVGSHDLSARAGGFAAGLDYRLTRDTVLGFALAGGGTSWSLAQGLGGGNSDAFQAGIYGATRWGAAYAAASLAFANHWMSTDRFAAFGDHLAASFAAQSVGARLEGGYRLATAAGGVTPYAALTAQSFHTPAYREIDAAAGGFGLAYAARSADATRGELGARFDRVTAVAPSALLILRGRLAWAHDRVSDPALAAVFQALPGASFVVNGATPAKDSALASAGAELKLVNGVALSGRFDGEFANGSHTYAGAGTLRVSW